MLDVVLTVIVHVVVGVVSVPPVSVIIAVVATAVTPPPQPFTSPLGVAITKPAGSVSVKLIPVWVGLPAPLVMVKVSALI